MSVVDQLQQKIADHAIDIVRRAADLAVTLTQAAASERTGALRESISHDEPAMSGSIASCQIVAAAEYARYEDEGTGIYGPTGQRIVARPGGVLAFDWPAAGGMVFFKSVAGSPGKHYFTEPMPGRWSECVHVSGGVA